MMLRPSAAAAIACLALCASAITSAREDAAQGPAPHPPELSEGDGAAWISLFDGTSLAGWRGYKRTDASQTRWTVQDGMLTLPAKSSPDTRAADIITADTFDLFELRWEWKISPGGNSGVKYFILEDRNSAIGHEYQIIDDTKHADAKIGAHRQTAAFYDVLPARVPPPLQKPAGQWNTSVVRVAPSRAVRGGTRVYHYLNEARVLEYELGSSELSAAIEKSKFKGIERFGKLQRGHILLQDHGDQVWYRNIRIRRLSGSE